MGILTEWPFAPESRPPAPGPDVDVGTPAAKTGPESPYITISGLPQFDNQFIAFPGPGIGTSGAPGPGRSVGFDQEIDASLSSLQATFGFNQQPHRFTLEWVPTDFNQEALPTINAPVSFKIGNTDFLVEGRVVHANWHKSMRGKVLQVSVEDIRKDLNEFVLDTYGLHGFEDTPDPGIVDVHYWFLQTKQDLDRRQFNLFEEHGATYRDIYDAVEYFENQLGTINGVLEKIPEPHIIDAQLPESLDSYRWRFRATPLLSALQTILGEVSYDFYWIMKERRIGVINRKFQVNVTKDSIPIEGDTAPVLDLKFGADEGERPTKVRVFGARMEGIIGATTGNTGQFEPSVAPTGDPSLGIQTDMSFEPGWRGTIIQYYGPDGALQSHEPSDRELAAALKGIEFWAEHVEIENRISNFTIDPFSGDTVQRFAPAAPSGLGKVVNRGQDDKNWAIQWYNRTRNFAQNHFGRTYVLSQSSQLYQELNKFDVVQEAWCNVENLTEGGTYQDGYKIKGTYRYLSPFWDETQNKMRAYAEMPGTTKWGTDGNGVPAQFDQWNESQATQYVPIEVKKWDRPQDKFGGNETLLYPLREPKGLMIRLPNIAISRFDDHTEVQNYDVVKFFKGRFDGETTYDIRQDPTKLAIPAEQPSFVAIPIQVNRRYGYSWPSEWAAGAGTNFEVQAKEDLAPWKFEPRGDKPSWERMDEEGTSVVSSRLVDRDEVTFGEAQKLGLPIISFDEFASQEAQAVNNLPVHGGSQQYAYGVLQHGVTQLGISKNLQWWQTRYSVKSHFPTAVKARPVKEITEEDFRFIVKRLETDIPRKPPGGFPYEPPNIFDPGGEDGREQIIDADLLEKIEVPVTIVQVYERSNGDFYYKGKDWRGTIWPAWFRSGYVPFRWDVEPQKYATAIDGFLQIGMKAVYHYEELDGGDYVHYYTGGVTLSDNRIVQLKTVPQIVSQADGLWRADIETLQETVFYEDPASGTEEEAVIQPFLIRNVPMADQDNVDLSRLTVGSRILMSGTGNDNNAVRPNADILNNTKQKDRVWLVNTGGGAGGLSIGRVTSAPEANEGRDGAIQTISDTSGTIWEDGGKFGTGAAAQDVIVDFIGIEFGFIQVGDTCMYAQTTEELTAEEVAAGQRPAIRILVYIPKPLFMNTDAWGQSIL